MLISCLHNWLNTFFCHEGCETWSLGVSFQLKNPMAGIFKTMSSFKKQSQKDIVLWELILKISITWSLTSAIWLSGLNVERKANGRHMHIHISETETANRWTKSQRLFLA